MSNHIFNVIKPLMHKNTNNGIVKIKENNANDSQIMAM